MTAEQIGIPPQSTLYAITIEPSSGIEPSQIGMAIVPSRVCSLAHISRFEDRGIHKNSIVWGKRVRADGNRHQVLLNFDNSSSILEDATLYVYSRTRLNKGVTVRLKKMDGGVSDKVLELNAQNRFLSQVGIVKPSPLPLKNGMMVNAQLLRQVNWFRLLPDAPEDFYGSTSISGERFDFEEWESNIFLAKHKKKPLTHRVVVVPSEREEDRFSSIEKMLVQLPDGYAKTLYMGQHSASFVGDDLKTIHLIDFEHPNAPPVAWRIPELTNSAFLRPDNKFSESHYAALIALEMVRQGGNVFYQNPKIWLDSTP